MCCCTGRDTKLDALFNEESLTGAGTGVKSVAADGMAGVEVCH